MARLIVALDLPNLAAATALVTRIAAMRPIFKIGYEAYYGFGPQLLDHIRSFDGEIFLDLKLHDIPRTVAAAVRALLQPGISLLTVHALGGEEMMQAAVAAAQECSSTGGFAPPKIFGVTILTSLSEFTLPELGLTGGSGENVVRLAALARNAGCAGVVCSPEEVSDLKAFFGRDFAALCPGIRGLDDARGDQRRVATATQAVQAGADYLVVGRPITEAEDPTAATRAILAEIEHAHILRGTHS